MHIFKSMHNGDILLEDIEKEQVELKKRFMSHKAGRPKR